MKNVLREFLKFQEANPHIDSHDDLINDFFLYTDYIEGMTWSKEDIRMHAMDNGVTITEDQVNEVATLLTTKSDAELGINWDVIYYRIIEVTKQ